MAERKETNNPSMFSLKVTFKRDQLDAKDPIRLEPQNIRELSITLDINRFLPSFRMRLNDAAGYLSNFVPFDRSLSRLTIELSSNAKADPENATSFDFDVYRRTPDDKLTYPMEGLLQIKNLFAPNKIRSLSGNLRLIIESLANEMGIYGAITNTPSSSVWNRLQKTITGNTNRSFKNEISGSLDYDKDILQPNWTNGELLGYLQDNLIGKSGETGYFCFIKSDGMSKVLVFKSLNDFYLAPPKYRFCLMPNKVSVDNVDFFPIIEYKVCDSYKMLGISGCKRQDYMYYDYNTSALVKDSVNAVGGSHPYPSLTSFFLIDQDDSETDNTSIDSCGRSNSFTSDFKGSVTNVLHKRLTNLSKIWITTWGLDDIYPGNIVDINQFPHQVPDTQYAISQIYNGYWMVERVVHLVGFTYMTRLLLTRNGVNTMLPTTLVPASQGKMKKN